MTDFSWGPDRAEVPLKLRLEEAVAGSVWRSLSDARAPTFELPSFDVELSIALADDLMGGGLVGLPHVIPMGMVMPDAMVDDALDALEDEVDR